MSCLRLASCQRIAVATGLGKPTHYAVRGSVLLGDNRGPAPVGTVTEPMQAPTSPAQVAKNFTEQQVMGTRADPTWKLSREASCGTCRRPLHRGPCRRPERTPPQGANAKVSEFNSGMHGHEAPMCTSAPATGDVGTARVRSDDPAMAASTAMRAPQAGTVNDNSLNFAGRYNKTSNENRGPTVNPYLERPVDLSQPSPEVDVPATLARLFGDCADTFSNADSGAHPQGGPAV